MTNQKTPASFDPKAFLARVGEGKTILEYRKDQVVFAQGDTADTVFYIQKGRVKVVVISEHGKEAVVGILEPGQFFGEGCINGHKLRISTTTALDASSSVRGGPVGSPAGAPGVGHVAPSSPTGGSPGSRSRFV